MFRNSAHAAALLRAIRSSGFDGSVTFEHDGYPDSLRFVERSMAFWQQGWENV